VRRITVPAVESCVGTIRAVHETAVASKLLARVVAVHVTAGQAVAAGDVLVELESEDLKARVSQARAARAAAVARRDQARIEFERTQQVFDGGAATQTELDRTRNALLAAEANVEAAAQSEAEADAMVAYATIQAPMNGLVIDKQVDVGDTATPGQVVVTIYDPTRMQLLASVRESLTHDLEVGQAVDVHIDAIGRTCQGLIREIVPQAQAQSRSFLVKVAGPCPPGVYSGMFGRLLIPLPEETVVVAPASALAQVGQLDVVDVVEDGRLARRVVTLGRRFGAEVEVLSGLAPGEMVATAAPSRRETP
jgi:RND family efflux transporter MFP subunit